MLIVKSNAKYAPPSLALRGIDMGEWIKCSERMPPDGDEVLIFTRSGHISLDAWDEVHEDPIGMGGPTISIGHYWGAWEYEDISHWMPLPKPPVAL